MTMMPDREATRKRGREDEDEDAGAGAGAGAGASADERPRKIHAPGGGETSASIAMDLDRTSSLGNNDSAELIEPCPEVARAERAAQYLDEIANALPEADPQARFTTTVCNKQAVCWNWVLYGGANETEADPREYIYDTFGNKRTAVRAKIDSVLEWRGMGQDDDSRLQVVVYVLKGGNLPHWEHRWTSPDGASYITVTKGIDEDLKAFNGKSVVPGSKPMIFKVSPDSLSENHLAALKSLAESSRA